MSYCHACLVSFYKFIKIRNKIHKLCNGYKNKIGEKKNMQNSPNAPIENVEEYEKKPINKILKPELNVQHLGLKTNNNIDCRGMPQKKYLYLELIERITNFINPDFRVFIDKDEFNCHLMVLQCYSEVFLSYVDTQKIELSSENCTCDAFAFIYGWMIGGKPSSLGMNRENVLDILNASKYLKISDLMDQCWMLIDSVNVFMESSAYSLYIDAKEKCLPEIKDLMLPRIKKFFLILVASKDWLHLDLEDVLNFLQSNYVCINCEMEIFLSAVRWLMHDWQNREQHKNAVMECVRFANIPECQLVLIKENPEFHDLINDQSIRKMIDDGLAYAIMKHCPAAKHEMLLALKPVARNWSNNTITYFTYRKFLICLDEQRRKTWKNRNVNGGDQHIPTNMQESDEGLQGNDDSTGTLSAACSSNSIDDFLSNRTKH